MKTTTPTKKYLGDGVHVDHDTRGLVLTTEGDWGPTSTVILAPKVFANLLAYLGISVPLIELDEPR